MYIYGVWQEGTYHSEIFPFSRWAGYVHTCVYMHRCVYIYTALCVYMPACIQAVFDFL